LTLIDVFSAMIGLEVGSLTCQVTDGRCDANAECLGGLDVAPRRGFQQSVLFERSSRQSV
jgi:hypothetical protein